VGLKCPEELTGTELRKLILALEKYGLKYIYTCGLGEPFEDEKLRSLIDLAGEKGIRISLFSNGILIDKAKAKWLFKNKVGIILKMDTFNEQHFDTILNKKGAARKVYRSMQNLLDAGFGSEDPEYTNLAFSIVPTKINYAEIPEVFDFALAHGIFPSVGELEYAGLAKQAAHTRQLLLTQAQLHKLHTEVDRKISANYMRPICPSIVSGIHIDNIGNCLVDKKTGLNCKWFMLQDPDEKLLGNIRYADIRKLADRAKAYREKCFKTNTTVINSLAKTKYIFGGCGGSPEKIIRLVQTMVS
jgi:MoaA/NifB/PqqE/SkfB family radical SAM enzyme